MNRLRQTTQNRFSQGAAWPFSRPSATRVQPNATNPVAAFLRRFGDDATSCNPIAGGSARSPFPSVVVPVDGQLYAEHGLPWALGIARGLGVPLHVLHIWPHDMSPEK